MGNVIEDVIVKTWLAVGVIIIVGFGLLLVSGCQAKSEEWTTRVVTAKKYRVPGLAARVVLEDEWLAQRFSQCGRARGTLVIVGPNSVYCRFD